MRSLDIRCEVRPEAVDLAIYGEITEGNAVQVLNALSFFKGRPIILSVYSGGGDVFASLGIRDAIAEAAVTARVYGLAASGAALLLTGAKRVEMTPFSQLMVHKAYKEGENKVKLYDADTDRINAMQVEAFSKRTGKTRASIQKWMDGGDMFFNAEEAINAGLADAIYTPARIAASLNTMQTMEEVMKTETTETPEVVEVVAQVETPADPGDEQPEPKDELETVEVEVPLTVGEAIQAALKGSFKASVNVSAKYGEIVASLTTEVKSLRAQLDEANAQVEALQPKADAAAAAETAAAEAVAKVAEVTAEVEKLKSEPIAPAVVPNAAPGVVTPGQPAAAAPQRSVMEERIEKGVNAIDAAIARRNKK